MTESKCNCCKLVISRTLKGVYANGRKQYTDTTGRVWAGFKCPDCKNRLSKVVESHRNCRKCSKKLPMSKYFYHENCAPVTDFYSAEDWGYQSYVRQI